MTNPAASIAMLAAAYLIGAIPFGLLIARAKGVDIRAVGSGNIGATNVGRALGRPYFYLCFALDALKGFAPTLAFGLLTNAADHDTRTTAQLWWWLAAMAAPVLGHMFSPYLGFRGGKGVATGLGSLLAVVPILTIPAALALATYLLVVRVTRYVGVASCSAALSLPLSTAALWLAGIGPWAAAWPAVAATALLAGVVTLKHRGNLARTLAGTEPRAGQPLTPRADDDR
jgi:glycerol-3-phosphate acyltransferase PlsY